MTDIVERLRTTPTKRTWDSVGRPYDYPEHLPREAADEIDRLRRLANDAADMLAEAQSGFISGCGSDMRWGERRDELVKELRGHH